MKNLLLLCLMGLALTGCDDNSHVSISKDEYLKLKGFTNPEYPKEIYVPNESFGHYDAEKGSMEHIIKIGECEYIFLGSHGYGGPSLCHKGDCNNPVHQYPKPLPCQ